MSKLVLHLAFTKPADRRTSAKPGSEGEAGVTSCRGCSKGLSKFRAGALGIILPELEDRTENASLPSGYWGGEVFRTNTVPT